MKMIRQQATLKRLAPPAWHAPASEPVPHPASEPGIAVLEADLRYILTRVPMQCRLHLEKNFHRLRRGSYSTPDGGGCLMYLLTESLPANERITTKESLIRFWTGKSGLNFCSAQNFQPAKWLVRAHDLQPCLRYHGQTLEFDTLRRILHEVLAASLRTDGPLPPAPLHVFPDEEAN